MKKLISIFAVFFSLSTSYSYAQTTPPEPRSISVSGEAEEQAAPDQAVLSVSLISKNMDLTKAKQENDELVEKLVNIIHQYAIPKEKVSTSNVSIEPQYTYDNGKQHMDGYAVSRALRITIDKIDQSERILASIVDAKIDQVNGLEFQLADQESHMDQVRVKAYANAKAKAETLAKAAGAKLGAPLFILADDAMPPPMRPMPRMAMAAMKQEASVAPSLPGMINMHASVSVTFELD
jgi:uncharacterized protein YggE